MINLPHLEISIQTQEQTHLRIRITDARSLMQGKELNGY